ncbi:MULTISPECIES: DUF6629 family protein [Novosphingopyxis]|uniref:DUF6629 family protein n=1 Tax=Novosphingopyxis TaxID=2709686 RepID=UPI0016514D09|nr:MULTISPECIES: DUF6629 family protein [Novosphingopyxis]MBH9536509.1 hypothetical protein [Novosphingopyxis sp. YJ-S2-01]|tara:strand:- start:449 stop:1099 length:651 start_codon:yes stop_codon:yes gene_type:complete
MCFSAEMNFVAAAGIGAVGLATMRHVKHPREVLLAAMPLLFALHQFTEGFVWLGLTGRINAMARDNTAFLFVLYAQALLPFLMPLSVWLLERQTWRRWVIGALTLLALGFSCYMTYSVVGFENCTYVEQNSIVYRNPRAESLWTGAIYILVTCGSLVLSGNKVVRWFGVLNLIGLSIVAAVKEYAFSSVWCFYAAVLSVMLYFMFRQDRIRYANDD